LVRKKRLVVEPLAVEQPADDLERLLHAPYLLAGVGPVHAAGNLVQRLAGADPEETGPLGESSSTVAANWATTAGL
jgi:hypothetical protein